jgi:homoserine O-acetyltransferase
MARLLFAFGMFLMAAVDPATAQTSWPHQRSADFTIKDFRFASGQVLPELKLRYMTIGEPRRNGAGEIANAVLLLHGSSTAGSMWLNASLANELFGPGQPLDASKYFLVIPDGIGRGGSSKPSDGLRAKFPNYRYADMVETQHRLLTEALGVKRVRLVMGVSMGGMHAWMWAGLHPEFMDAVVPIASQPAAISGRNWITRRIAIEAIRNDPEWNNGDYAKNPTRYVLTAPFSALMAENVAVLQETAPTREAGDALYARLVERARAGDANNQLYSIEAVMDYDPAPNLTRVKARLVAINFADDAVNPPELGVTERAVAKIPNARYVLVPAGETTRGHFTYMQAALWKAHVAALLREGGE